MCVCVCVCVCVSERERDLFNKKGYFGEKAREIFTIFFIRSDPALFRIGVKFEFFQTFKNFRFKAICSGGKSIRELLA